MVAFWDTSERCVFANEAYLKWFGKSPKEMKGISLRELLGPIYERNLPYIRKALGGEVQQFERQITMPSGEVGETVATYTPEFVDGKVSGFGVVVTDVTLLRQREASLHKAIEDRNNALSDVRTLEGLLPICAGCKSIRDENGKWHTIEAYVTDHTKAQLSHGMCPECVRKYYPGG
jgi:PAS domain S-box-containing protein